MKNKKYEVVYTTTLPIDAESADMALRIADQELARENGRQLFTLSKIRVNEKKTPILERPKAEDIDIAVELKVMINTKAHYDSVNNQGWVLYKEDKFFKDVDSFGDIDSDKLDEEDGYTTFRVQWPDYVKVNVKKLKTHIAKMFARHLILETY